jgi:glycosyltransferase involved in cell wall biosynthesis
MSTTLTDSPLDLLTASPDVPELAAAHEMETGDRPNRSTPLKTVRVLHVINGEHYSGAERVQDLLAARLPELSFDVGFACVKPDRFPKMRQSLDAPLYEVPMRGRFDLRAIIKIRDIIRREGYALVHAHTPRSALMGRVASALARVPMVYHVHSPTSRDTTHRVRNWLNHYSEKLSLTGVARLITVSESLARHMQRQGYRQDRITVVPNGVPALDEVPPRDTPRGTWTLGAVALFRPRKGMEVLLDALALLREQHLPVQLRAVGPFETPEYEADIRRRVARLKLEDAVHWTGFTRDVNAELMQMDMFVLPSLFGEGLPMVVLEAMAAGVPVVGTQVEGVPEAIRHGIDGLIANPGDPADLSRTIACVINGDLSWSELRNNALARHAEKFSDLAMATGVAAAYDKVLANTSPK